MNKFLLLVQFFTTIPVKKSLSFDQEEFHQSAWYMPLLGLFVGVLQLSFAWTLSQMFSREWTLSMLFLFSFFLTGGLHLDGLADTFDGLFSGRKREEMLEIMKDSRLGTHGVLSLGFLFLLKFQLLYWMPKDLFYPVVFLLPLLGRSILLGVCPKTPYARKEGFGQLFIGKVSLGTAWMAHGVTIFFLWWMLSYGGVVAYGLVMLCGVLLKRKVVTLLGGLTGDILGAFLEGGEVLFLFFYVLQKGGL
ncbi:MAG TPA: adenosylcobinamide-GDP ribazoletransferase [Clostridiaceae bacterium]|nr:adenosylcobinamide-GDP ribazoletransferase [Clostridiaceae bacterium]